MPVETPSLRLSPLLAPRPWGGRRLAALFASDLNDVVGEAWLAHGGSVLDDGEYGGATLDEALEELGPSFVGSEPFRRYGSMMPLIVKLLDTADWLSVQVHPDDVYAGRFEADTGYQGKNEAWYVLEASPDAAFALGLTASVDRRVLRHMAEAGDFGDLLHIEEARVGDLVYVPAGTIHTLGPGLLVYEVQQRSDLTYRLFDFGRGRELQLDKGLDVARLVPGPPVRPRSYRDGRSEVLLAGPHFMLCRYELLEPGVIRAPEESMSVFTNLSTGGRAATFVAGAGRHVRLTTGVWLETFVPSATRLAGLPPWVRVGPDVP